MWSSSSFTKTYTRVCTRAYADCRRSCLYFCRRLRPAHKRAYADCRRQSSNMLNFQGQRRPASQSRKRSKVAEGRRVVLHRDVCGRIPTHTLACLYFYPRRNLRYAVATRRQPQAWTSAPAAGAYARMKYKPGLNRRAYASVYVRIRPYAEQRVGPRWPWSAFVIGWNACAGLRWPWKLNIFELWRRQSAYALGATGDSCADSRRMREYTRVYARMEYKPGFIQCSAIFNIMSCCRYLSTLPWIFPEAPLKINGAPGNIQGNLTGMMLDCIVMGPLACNHLSMFKPHRMGHGQHPNLKWIWRNQSLFVKGACVENRMIW